MQKRGRVCRQPSTVCHRATPPQWSCDTCRGCPTQRPQQVAALPDDLGTRFDLRSVTEFERAVLLKAREIPRGEVRTYAWIAAQIGHPSAVRAVGSALRKNPVPVLIPCHRVVRSDGHIGGYALGGNAAKVRILAAEGLQQEEIQRLARRWRPDHGK